MSVYNRTLKMKMHNMICQYRIWQSEQPLNRVNFEPISPPSYLRTLTQFDIMFANEPLAKVFFEGLSMRNK